MNKLIPSYERYQRQIILKEFGEAGQQKLEQSIVLVIGVGGLGCPALQYLAAAGIGQIEIVDDDVVSLHNLHRQVLFTTNDIGLPKAEVAARQLQAMNPDVEINAHSFRLTTQNALELIGRCDIVLDATDNFAARYLINDACVLLSKPLVYGAISQFEGQAAVFNASENSVNYRDLFPQPPLPGSVLSCAEAGVLGVLPGIIGTVQASEVIKLVTGIGRTLVNQLFTYNALTNESFVFSLTAKAETAALLPKTKKEFEETDYAWLCGETASLVQEIDAVQFSTLLHQPSITIVDVREKGEQPSIKAFPHQNLPLSSLRQINFSTDNNTIVLFCQSGKRSQEAARILSSTFGSTKKVFSLRGGIVNWLNNGSQKA